MNLDYVIEYSKKAEIISCLRSEDFPNWRVRGSTFSIFFLFFFFKEEMMVKISTFYYVEYNKEMRVFCKIECCRRKVMLLK